MHSSSTRLAPLRRALVLFAVVAASVATSAAVSAAPAPAAPATPSAARAGRTDGILETLLGTSRKLRARFVHPGKPAEFSLLQRLFGDTVTSRAGVYTVTDSVMGSAFSLITLRPFSDKVGGRIGSYRMGYWPFEGRAARTPSYGDPQGFIEVTAANQGTYVSEHFRLHDFLTHDQQAVWPKYLVLDERLIDKLELVIDEMEREGVPVKHLSVMSGFRTPQYNIRGVGAGGRAKSSRHQYGDAADVFVDNDGDGWTDDITGDGRVDVRDAQRILRAVEAVERAHPELIGGVGVYPATRAHGPFAHVDARGYRARWGEG